MNECVLLVMSYSRRLGRIIAPRRSDRIVSCTLSPRAVRVEFQWCHGRLGWEIKVVGLVQVGDERKQEVICCSTWKKDGF